MDYQPGIYVVQSDTLLIRREPRITPNNQVGKLNAGTKRAVYLIKVNDADNSVWGRVSLYDSAGIAEWCCIKNINREFMKFESPLENSPIPTNTNQEPVYSKVQLDRIEQKLDRLLELLKK